MSPRPSQRSDDDILARTVVAVRRHGPGVTLTRIGREVGLTPGRLVQRFGSRAELLAAAERRADERTLAAVREGLDRPDAGPDQLIVRLADVAERNARRLHLLSNSYLFDPGHLAARTGARDAKVREAGYLIAFRAVLDRAVRLRRLAAHDTESMARALFVGWVGSYTTWAYAPTGSLRETVIRDLTFLLAGYRRSPRGPARLRATGRSRPIRRTAP